MIAVLQFTAVAAFAASATLPSDNLDQPFAEAAPKAFSNENGPCQLDLIEVCNLQYPTTYQGIFDARMCLWGNRDKITQECMQYLLVDSPSVVEPCFEPISTYCKDISPGDNRIHNCLRTKAEDKLSEECLKIVERDFLWTANTVHDHRLPEVYSEGLEGDDITGKDRDYDDASVSPDIVVEEAAEYAYLVQKLQSQQPNAVDSNDKDSIARKIFEVVAFQDVLASFSVLPYVQQFQEFLLHVNDELTMLESSLMKLLSQEDEGEVDGEADEFSEAEADEEAVASLSQEDDEYYADDINSNNVEANSRPFVHRSNCNDPYDDDCTDEADTSASTMLLLPKSISSSSSSSSSLRGSHQNNNNRHLNNPAASFSALASLMTMSQQQQPSSSSQQQQQQKQPTKYQSTGLASPEEEDEEEVNAGDHLLAQAEESSTMSPDDDGWRKASMKIFSLPEPISTLPLTTDAILDAPRKMVQVVVQSTMSAKKSLRGGSAAANSEHVSSSEESSNNNNNNNMQLHNSSQGRFLEAMRSMILNALQDPRQ